MLRLLKLSGLMAVAIGVAILLMLSFSGDLSAPRLDHAPGPEPPTHDRRNDTTKAEADTNEPKQPDTDTQAAENNPLSGSVRVRVVNDRTGEPVANTRCALLHLEYILVKGEPPEWYNDDDEYLPEWPYRLDDLYARTNERGEVELDVKFREDDEDEEYDEDATFIEGALYPLPDGFRPVTTYPHFTAALKTAAESPTTDAIEVRVAPLARIHGRVTTPDGAPAEGVQILVSVTPYSEGWEPPNYDDGLARSWWVYLVNGRNRFASLSVGLPDEVRIAEEWRHCDEMKRVKDLSPAVFTDDDGRFSFPAWEGDWKLGTSGGGHEAAFGTVSHAHEDSHVELQLGSRLSSLSLTVNLRVPLEPDETDDDWDEEWEEEQGNFWLTIEEVGPLAPPYHSAGPESFYKYYGSFDPGDLTSVRFEIDNLPPIWLAVEVQWGTKQNHARIRLQPGQAGELVIDVGEGMLEVELVGLPPNERGFDIAVERPPALFQESVYLPAEDGFRAPLTPGDYIARLAGCDPVPFTISSGALTRIRFDPQSNPVEFQLDEALAERMGGPPTLSLYALRASPAAAAIGVGRQPGLQRLAETFTGNLENLEFEDWRIELNLPPGGYAWKLKRGSIEIAAPIDLRSLAGPVVFREDSLPGLERLDVDLSAAPDVQFTHTSGRSGNMRHTGHERSESAPPGGVIRVPHEERAIVWAAPGIIELMFQPIIPYAAPEMHSSLGPLWLWRADVTVPGSFRVPALAEVIPVDVGGFFPTRRGRVTALRLDLPHSFWIDFNPVLGELLLPKGEYELQLRTANGRYSWRGYVDSPFTLRRDDVTEVEQPFVPDVYIKWMLPMPDKRFDPSAPEPPRDLIERMYGATVTMYRRDNGRWVPIRKHSGRTWLSYFDSEGAALGVSARLEPGRYRVEPWHGAPVELVREFEVPEGLGHEGMSITIPLR